MIEMCFTYSSDYYECDNKEINYEKEAKMSQSVEISSDYNECDDKKDNYEKEAKTSQCVKNFVGQ